MIAGAGFWDLEIERTGWTRAMWPPQSAFPEVVGRPGVWGRNFYTRGADRLVIEWSDEVSICAVLRNGVEWRVASDADLMAVIRPQPAGGAYG